MKNYSAEETHQLRNVTKELIKEQIQGPWYLDENNNRTRALLSGKRISLAKYVKDKVSEFQEKGMIAKDVQDILDELRAFHAKTKQEPIKINRKK